MRAIRVGESLSLIVGDDAVPNESHAFRGGLSALGRVAFTDLFALTPGETWVLVQREGVEPVEGISQAGHDLWLAWTWCLWREQRGSRRRPYNQYFTLDERGEVLALDSEAVEQFLNPSPAPAEEESNGPMAEALKRAGLL